jgi:GrpB-like predicted nucleotidyltransferase (UPF0157 family)
MVELLPHCLIWSEMAARESTRLAELLGHNLVAVHHIGSTSIPGIRAKPLVDLMPAVRSLAALDEAEAGFVALGYEWRGEFGIPGRRFCMLTDAATGLRVFNVHCFETDTPGMRRHLAFRDFLRAHPDKAREYETEKLRCQRLHRDDARAYSEAKGPWIKAMELEALSWAAGGVSFQPSNVVS